MSLYIEVRRMTRVVVREKRRDMERYDEEEEVGESIDV